MCILKNLFKLNIKQLTLYLCYFMLSFTAFSLNRNSEKIGTYLYGVTIDDSWDYNSTNISKIVKALKNMPVKPVARIVMSYDVSPEEYRDLFKEVNKVAYIMATPVDSSEMKKYRNVESYLRRFRKSYAVLSEYVDIWEIGNEVNGENWLGKNPQLIADKVYAAYNFIHKEKNSSTALTSYYFSPGNQKISMDEWLIKYIPNDMKKNLDYVLVSYYEDDNEGFQPDWKNVFQKLKNIFPNSKLGIGECGNSDSKATAESKIKMINHYYRMPRYTKNYIGGYFWWYWVQDAVFQKDGYKIQNEINKNINYTNMNLK